MSTSAESAQQWLEEKQPSREEVHQVATKLEQRIEQHQGDEESIQGSVDALVLLQDYLEQLEAPQAAPAPEATLDSSNLIPDSQPVQLEEDVKRKTFEALKNQFKDL